MNQQHRIQKTLDRKVRDLEDHLYFLRESLAKLAEGDEAYRKQLTAELRVLVCMSSGTEGLLWRILDELQIGDDVHVHLPGYIPNDHPLSQGLRFEFSHVWRAGAGDPHANPRKSTGHYSLKKIIKECKALKASGADYTHETLIKAVAQQMGSGHEDDRVDPYLIELIGTIISDETVLNTVLTSDADLVLEVGERALAEAVQRIDFVRSARPAIAVPCERTVPIPGVQGADFESTPPTLTQEGTMIFCVNHQHPDWKTNSCGYDFGVVSQDPLVGKGSETP